MSDSSSRENIFSSTVLGHPSALFVLFFTEMWERFSFYGMRVLLVLFLTAGLLSNNPGWEWPRENALALIGTYGSLLYLTPLIGGYVADKITGYRVAVVIGCVIMTLGHAAMALETKSSFYLGLGLLVIGTGFFKPNITSIISNMYKGKDEKKDGAYTIFYMGVNAGAFFGMMICGYLAENFGWSWGFGLAGIFMMLGCLQFWLARPIFGDIGAKPTRYNLTPDLPLTDAKFEELEDGPKVVNQETDKRNPFRMFDYVLMVVSAVGGLLYLFNDPLEKIEKINLLPFKVGSLSGTHFVVLVALVSFLILLITRIIRYSPITRDRIIAVCFCGLFTVFFFMAFEQSLGSMTIFADSYTDRELVGSSAMIFKIIDALLTTVPLIIITWVLLKLFGQTFRKISLSNIFLGIAFMGIWCLVIFRLVNKFSEPGNTIDASWFAILNSFFIISLAPLFSKWWESKYNPSAGMKYGFGLILLGIGFGILAFGAWDIPQGAMTAKVSIIFLILAYLFHTMGELCLSPLGLSYVSKLVPPRMIAFMFGVWYLAIAVGQKSAGAMGGMIDKISEAYSIGTFFLIFTIVPIGMGLLAMSLSPIMKKLMHGIK
ncbi:peptide MFS transporter [Moheibacter sediminis]|uniref:Proton-dependent oligopeptide transporter, POT family n=1 Tax=Moheibacter sediminis TaxID=1434700 RepID=A0A1W2BGL1_9FLAO|nr:peptide MFS transporter [Moheibacter sediminis]SMC71882.1 proton-dependent oligopeptide transporter, POT family [Moheibacter sediminis]